MRGAALSHKPGKKSKKKSAEAGKVNKKKKKPYVFLEKCRRRGSEETCL